ncbi:MAG TPA: cbb3-type cytochrome c oxidase subunit 3 [Woeseiaceae bacterium]|nr:cbb3-type cytochrome c oxidase subunit 3 [Woeseiaceae bacterium]
MDIGIFRGLITATLFLLFIGIWAWSWSRKRKDDFQRAANVPLEDDSKPPPHEPKEEQSQ